jgi:hypothetical protein
MLLFSSRSLTVNGITVFPDHADTNQFWYLPGPVGLENMAGSTEPQFLLTLYAPDVAGAGIQGIGFLNVTLALKLRDDDRAAIIGQIRAQFEVDDPLLSPVPFDEGTVQIVSLDAQGSGGTAGGGQAVERILGASSPELFGNNDALFAMTLTEEGATILQQAFKDGMTPVGGIYNLKFTGVLPALDVKITADLKRVYESFSVDLTAQYYAQVGIDATFEKLRQDGAIKIEVVNLTTDGSAAASETWALNLFKDQIISTWFQPSLSPTTAQAADAQSVQLPPARTTTTTSSSGSSLTGGTQARTAGGSAGGAGGSGGMTSGTSAAHGMSSASTSGTAVPARTGAAGAPTTASAGAAGSATAAAGTPTTGATSAPTTGATGTATGATGTSGGTTSTNGTPTTGAASSGGNVATNTSSGNSSQTTTTSGGQGKPNPLSGLPGTASNASAAASPFGASLKLKFVSQDEQKTVQYEYDQMNAVQRTYAPQGYFGLLLQSVDPSKHFLKVDGSDPFFNRFAVEVHPPKDFSGIGLLVAHVALDYGDPAGAAGVKHGDFSFDPNSAGPQTWDVYEGAIQQTQFRYTTDYKFDPESGWAGEQTAYAVSTVTTENRVLNLDPYEFLGFLQVAVSGGRIDADRVDRIEVALKYQSASGWQTATTIVVHAGAAPQVWKVRLADKEARTYSYSTQCYLKDGTTIGSPAVNSTASAIIVSDPFVGAINLTLQPAFDPTAYSLAIVEIAYQDTPHNYAFQTTMQLPAGSAAAVKVRIPLIDRTANSYQYRVTFVTTSNQSTQGSYITATDPLIVVNPGH